jgi:HSP20 family protein
LQHGAASSRFFFHVTNGSTFKDAEGENWSSLEAVDVTLANGMLSVRGEKKTERDDQDKDKNWHVVERSYGSFSRTIPLPFDPDPAKVEAKFDKGVLHVRLPKPAEVAKKQQKIEIKKA